MFFFQMFIHVDPAFLFPTAMWR